MALTRWRNLVVLLSLALLALVLVACGGGTTQTKPTSIPTVDPGQSILAKAGKALTDAKTLHGFFNLTLNGQNFAGKINSEIWNVPPAKNRIEVRQSSVSQVATGSVTVTDGKQLWQYDPAKNVVYKGPLPANANGVPEVGFAGAGGGQAQFLLNFVQNVFTHSNATLKSSSENVNGHEAYLLHVLPQGNSADSGAGSFNYNGDVSLDKRTYLPVKVNLNIDGIGNVVLDIPELDLDRPISNSTFTFVTPAGAQIQPLQQATPSSDNGSLSLVQAQKRAGYHLLSIPGDQSDYVLQGVVALGSPGSQIFTLNYMKGNIKFNISEGKPLANLPSNGGKQGSVRGTTGVLSSDNGATTLAWTEKGIGIRITGPLSNDQLVALATSLT